MTVLTHAHLCQKVDACWCLNGHYFIDFKEFNNHAVQVTYEEMATAMSGADVGIPKEDVLLVLDSADYNMDGKINFSEFRALILGH